MSDTPRRRRRTPVQSPTSMIVNFFLDAPLETAQAAQELAMALLARRTASEEVTQKLQRAVTTMKAAPTRAIVQPLPPIGPTVHAPLSPALAQEAAPAPAPPPAMPRAPRVRRPAVSEGTSQPRQRAKRSDAGVPRTGRPRPEVDIPLPGTTASAAPLPELPEQDVPYEARVDEPVEVV